MTNNIDDFTAKTPSMIMIGKNVTALPEPAKNWKTDMSYHLRTSAIVQQIQKGWIKDIQSLPQLRLKWKGVVDPPKLGQLVLVKQNDVKPLYWPMARIIKHIPDKEGVVRMVQVIRGVTSDCYPSKTKSYPVENRMEVKHLSQLRVLPLDVEPEHLKLLPNQKDSAAGEE